MRPSTVTRSVILIAILTVMSLGFAQEHLVLTSGGTCICHAPIYVALENGIFEKHGLNVEIMRVASGFEALTAVQTGSAHVADAVVAVVAQAAQQGINVSAVVMANGDPSGTATTDNYFAIIGRESGGFQEGQLSDLVGKIVGVPTGTIAHQYLYYALRDNGFDPETDITVQHVSPPDLPSALQSGSIDVMVAWEPLPLQAMSMIEDAVEVYRGGNHIQYLFMRWMKPEFVQDNPETVRNFVAAFAEAAQYTRQNPDEAVAILADDFLGLDEAVIAQALEYLTFDPRVSMATLEAVEQGLEFARTTGGLEGEFEFSERSNLEALNQVMTTYPELFSDLPEIPEDHQLQ